MRRYGLYMLPVAAGLLAKQPTAVFPAILFAWIWLFEEEDFWKAVVRSLPSFFITGALAGFVIKMGAGRALGYGSPYEFRISQPAVLLSYFRRFFLPIDFSGDTDRRAYTSALDPRALLGFLFILVMCAVILWCRRRRELRPISFGFFWFITCSLPTSLFAIGEVENDHRLFLPYVGLAMGLTWAAALWLARRRLPRYAVAAACALILASAAWGTHVRNIVWHTDESFWLDVSRKSPQNGRGLMNYGLSQMALGRYPVALDYYTRALAYNPYYPTLEINLGVVNGALGNTAEAEKHFVRAIKLDPTSAASKVYYAHWLDKVGRTKEAIKVLRSAVSQTPDYIEGRYQLMQIYGRLGDRENLRTQATETLALFPTDGQAARWLARVPMLIAAPVLPVGIDEPGNPTPEGYLNASLAYYNAGKYPETVAAARKALALRPNYANAWNNMMAAYNRMSDWDNAIAAGEKAVSLDPASVLARNNLAFAKAQKAKEAKHP